MPVKTSTLMTSLFSLALLVFGITPLHADPASPPTTGQPPAKPAREQMRQHVANDMGLSAEQQKAFGQAMQLHHECMKADHEFHEKVRELVNSDQYNEKALKAMISQHQKDSETKILAAAKAMHDFHASLSPEQKAKMDEKHKKMKEQMHDRMKDRMMGPGPRPMLQEGK